MKEPQPPTTWAAGRFFSARCFGVALALLLCAVFPRVLLGLRSFVERDFGVWSYPVCAYIRECMQAGEIPLWNPLSNCGAPLLAQWVPMALYPFSILYLLFPMPWSVNFFSLLHLWWGGLGMYYLARHWVNQPAAGVLAGAAFVFNGATLSALVWPNFTVALGWMPWVVWLTERAMHGGGRLLLAATAAAAMQLLSGFPELVMMTWLVVGIVAVHLCIRRYEPWRTVFLRLMGIILLASGLVAIQILPFLDLLGHSQRSFEFATSKWQMPGWGLGAFLVPLFHCFHTYQGQYFQFGQVFMTSYYLGMGLLLLAIYGVLCGRNRRAMVLALLAVFSLVMALGDQALLYSWIRWLFPPIGVARYMIKFVFLTAFATPLLAAFGLAALMRSEPSKCKLSVLGIILLSLILLSSLVLWLAWRHPFPYDNWPATLNNGLMRLAFACAMGVALVIMVRARRVQWQITASMAVVALQMADVLSHAPWQNPTVPSDAYGSGLEERLPKVPLGEGRVMITPQAEAQLLRSTVPDFTQDLLGKRLALWSHLNLLEGVAKINGSSTLQMAPQARVQARMYATNNTSFPHLEAFLGARYFSNPTNVTQWVPATNALPLITGGQVPVFVDDAMSLDALFTPDFNPQGVVYLPEAARSLVSVTQGCVITIANTQWKAHRISCEVEAPQPAMVVLAQTYYHSWHVYVNGQSTPLWRANHAFQAVQVPAGKSRIEWVYEDRSFRAGAVISLSALILMALLYWRWRPRPITNAGVS